MLFLGATAAKSLLGSSFRLTRSRGEPLESDLAPCVMATIHPAAILRAPDGEARQAEREAFTRDLEAVAARLGGA
jgi:DNA polymerase